LKTKLLLLFTILSAIFGLSVNGQTWSPVGTGTDNDVYSLTEYNTELYVGGNFSTAGGNAANYIAKWNGTSWSAVGTFLNGRVLALAAYIPKPYRFPGNSA